jgi:23S rRNA pseudouridine1911/1915/1917 synthase
MSDFENSDIEDEGEIIALTIEGDQNGERLDKALSALCADLSRSRLQALIASGDVLLNGAVCENTSKKVTTGDEVSILVPPPVDALPKPENISLDIVYEDEDLLVINKPAGLVVHPGAGNVSGTLVNALLHHCAGQLSGIGGVMRPGIVHRLDKETSGLMVVAKSDRAHKGLSAQLEDRSLSRIYTALVLKVPVPMKGHVDMPIGRDPRHRLRMSVKGKGSKPARTHYFVEKRYADSLALVECQLESGRTHQIRVHMAAIKHPLVGDPLYGPQPTALRSSLKKLTDDEDILTEVLAFPRQALHARAITFIHPVTEEEMEFEADLPDDFSNLLNLINNIEIS